MYLIITLKQVPELKLNSQPPTSVLQEQKIAAKHSKYWILMHIPLDQNHIGLNRNTYFYSIIILNK